MRTTNTLQQYGVLRRRRGDQSRIAQIKLLILNRPNIRDTNASTAQQGKVGTRIRSLGTILKVWPECETNVLQLMETFPICINQVQFSAGDQCAKKSTLGQTPCRENRIDLIVDRNITCRNDNNGSVCIITEH